MRKRFKLSLKRLHVKNMRKMYLHMRGRMCAYADPEVKGFAK